MIASTEFLDLRLAVNDADVFGAERLRYKVFVEELGGDGDTVDHEGRFERDRFDAFCDHLILVDTRRSEADLNHVVGVYRLMRQSGADAAGQFYSEGEYDLSPLKTSGRTLLELGRSCIDLEYRGTTGMHMLWRGLGEYVVDQGIEVLFGVASFHGTTIEDKAEALSLLHHLYAAPPELSVRALENHYQSMDLVPLEDIDRPRATKSLPALIKAYLRLGGCVGDGAFIDHAFNTTDVMLIMDTERVTEQTRRRYAQIRA